MKRPKDYEKQKTRWIAPVTEVIELDPRDELKIKLTELKDLLDTMKNPTKSFLKTTLSEESPWLQGLGNVKKFPALKKDIAVDVVIIGGGLTGISAAYELRKTGKKVAVLEKADYAASTTAYTTAFLTYILDTNLPELVSRFGEQTAQLIWQSHQAALQKIKKNIQEADIDCEFMYCPEYLSAKNAEEYKQLQDTQTLAHTLGFDLSLSQAPLFNTYGYLEVPNQAKFHPLKYLLGLRQKAIENGVLYFENTEAKSITSGEEILVTTPTATVSAQDVIIATYAPFNTVPRNFSKETTTTYVYEATLKRNTISEGLYLDLAIPYHYLRIDKEEGYDRLLVGGEDHSKDSSVTDAQSYKKLREYLHTLLPNSEITFVRKWAGGIIESPDGLALIGQLPNEPHQFIATAFSGNGMTYATIAGLVITDVILGKTNPWTSLYDPKRFKNT